MTLQIKNRGLKLALLIVGMFFFAMAYIGPVAIMTPFAVLLGASTALAGLSVGVIFLLQAVMIVVFGIIADKYGKKVPILIGCLLMAVGTFLCPFSANVWELIAFRIIVGIGSGVFGLFGAVFASFFSRERTSVGMGIYMGTQGIGGFVGSLLAGIIAGIYGGGLFGYGTTFYYLGIFALIAAVCATIGTIELPRIKPTVLTEKPKGRGLGAIIRIRNIWTIVIANILLVMGIQTAGAFGSYMALGIGASVSIMGLVVGFTLLPSSLMGFPMGVAVLKIGNKRPAVIGASLAAVAIALMGYAYMSANLILLIGGALFLSIAMGLVQTPALAMAAGAVTSEEHSRAISLIMMAAILPGFLTILTGYLAQTSGFAITFYIVAILVLIGFGFMCLTREIKRDKSAQPITH